MWLSLRNTPLNHLRFYKRLTGLPGGWGHVDGTAGRGKRGCGDSQVRGGGCGDSQVRGGGCGDSQVRGGAVVGTARWGRAVVETAR